MWHEPCLSWLPAAAISLFKPKAASQITYGEVRDCRGVGVAVPPVVYTYRCHHIGSGNILANHTGLVKGYFVALIGASGRLV